MQEQEQADSKERQKMQGSSLDDKDKGVKIVETLNDTVQLYLDHARLNQALTKPIHRANTK